MSAPGPEVVVIGAGAAGLAAAYELARARIPTLVVEARPRLFGRVHTLHDPAWPAPIDLGAELVHDEAPLTTRFARRVGVTLEIMPERHRRVARQPSPFRDPDELLKYYLRSLGQGRDRSLAAVLAQYLRADPADLETVRLYVEGFHAAEVDAISARALRKLIHVPSSTAIQRRPVGGYEELLRGIQDALAFSAVGFRTGAPVTRVRWGKRRVRVEMGRRHLDVRAAVITVPLSLLQSGTLAIEPLPATWPHACGRLHMGSAQKIALLFAHPFWDEPSVRRRLGGGRVSPNFWHAPGEALPVWWTSAPRAAPLLTAWAGGPRAHVLRGLSTDALADRALGSLARIVAMPRAGLDALLLAARSHDWISDPWTRGAYSYVGVGGLAAQRELARPVAATLVLAGEALDARHVGTVEGALASGRRAARALLSEWKP